MKAERRHELQTNSLALWLRWRLPQIWQQHGTKILLGLIAVAIVIFIVRWRISAPKAAFARAQEALGQADQVFNSISGIVLAESPEALQRVKAGFLPSLVKRALDESDKPLIQARAYDLLGDYYYLLAESRVSSDATTRPFSTPIDRKQLEEAQTQYKRALETKIDQPDLIARAHIGLGTIAQTLAFESAVESAKQPAKEDKPYDWSKNPLWEEARQQFQAVVDDPKVPEAIKANARTQLREIARMQVPVMVARSGETPAVEPPTTRPTVLGPELPPSTTRPIAPAPAGATTRPAAPSTQGSR